MKRKIAAAVLAAVFIIHFLGQAGQAAEPGLLTTEQLTGEFQIEELYPFFMPIMCMAPGKWLVETVQIDAEIKEKVRSEFKQAVEGISVKLKPFPLYNNGRFLKPSVVIAPFFLTGVGRPGNTSAWYDLSRNMIVLTWHSVEDGVEGIRNDLLHEFGHWVWFNILDEVEKEEYGCIVGEPDQADLKLCEEYGVDPIFLVQEWFAEDFRVYIVGGEVKSKLGASRGDKEELARFFK